MEFGGRGFTSRGHSSAIVLLRKTTHAFDFRASGWAQFYLDSVLRVQIHGRDLEFSGDWILANEDVLLAIPVGYIAITDVDAVGAEVFEEWCEQDIPSIVPLHSLVLEKSVLLLVIANGHVVGVLSLRLEWHTRTATKMCRIVVCCHLLILSL